MTVDFRSAIERKLQELPQVHREKVTAYLDERAANGIKDSTLLLDLQNIAQCIAKKHPRRRCLNGAPEAYHFTHAVACGDLRWVPADDESTGWTDGVHQAAFLPS